MVCFYICLRERLPMMLVIQFIISLTETEKESIDSIAEKESIAVIHHICLLNCTQWPLLDTLVKQTLGPSYGQHVSGGFNPRVWLLSSVDQLVYLQFTFFFEGFVPLRADIWILSSVNHLVYMQSNCICNYLSQWGQMYGV